MGYLGKLTKRTLVRMMQIIVQSGIAKDRFQVLATQASALSDDLALAEVSTGTLSKSDLTSRIPSLLTQA